MNEQPGHCGCIWLFRLAAVAFLLDVLLYLPLDYICQRIVLPDGKS